MMCQGGVSYARNRNAKEVVAHREAHLRLMREDRQKGMTFQQIADKWEISYSTARTHTIDVVR